MSDAELTDYNNHPDAFFGVIHKQGKSATDPYEFFENIVEIHMSYPKSYVLNQIENWPDAERLKQLEHEDLVLEFCERLVAHLDKQNKPPN